MQVHNRVNVQIATKMMFVTEKITVQIFTTRSRMKMIVKVVVIVVKAIAVKIIVKAIAVKEVVVTDV
ncbi:MAG: hypothetical protein QF793_00915 [Candidatus Peribacteraceae bacterium]|nr:hypothetical protein [Candidatus Peribacteraceae bacterium]